MSEKKILGGNYGFFIWPGVTNNAIAAPIFGLNETVNTGFADLYIRPLELGWHADRADFIAGLGLYAPTGEWELGGTSNRGLGMWSYE